MDWFQSFGPVIEAMDTKLFRRADSKDNIGSERDFIVFIKPKYIRK